MSKKAKCLNGSPGEELLEEMFLKNENLRKKYRGTCDNNCQKKRKEVIKQLEDAGDEMDKTIFRDELVFVIIPFLATKELDKIRKKNHKNNKVRT